MMNSEEIDFSLDDAIVEDTWHWECPVCGATNSDVAGNDDVVECQNCRFLARPSDNGQLIPCLPCHHCRGEGVYLGERCSLCSGRGAITIPDLIHLLTPAFDAFQAVLLEWVHQMAKVLLPLFTEQMRAYLHTLQDVGMIRVYSLPNAKKRDGRRRSHRELMDIRRQRARKPFGVWTRDFIRLERG